MFFFLFFFVNPWEIDCIGLPLRSCLLSAITEWRNPCTPPPLPKICSVFMDTAEDIGPRSLRSDSFLGEAASPPRLGHQALSSRALRSALWWRASLFFFADRLAFFFMRALRHIWRAVFLLLLKGYDSSLVGVCGREASPSAK